MNCPWDATTSQSVPTREKSHQDASKFSAVWDREIVCCCLCSLLTRILLLLIVLLMAWQRGLGLALALCLAMGLAVAEGGGAHLLVHKSLLTNRPFANKDLPVRYRLFNVGSRSVASEDKTQLDVHNCPVDPLTRTNSKTFTHASFVHLSPPFCLFLLPTRLPLRCISSQEPTCQKLVSRTLYHHSTLLLSPLCVCNICQCLDDDM